MSSLGNCWDNALCESFFGSLKVECTDRYRFATRLQAKTVIFEYLEIFYNRCRLHSALGYTSPQKFENSASRTP
jgi:putative transposase